MLTLSCVVLEVFVEIDFGCDKNLEKIFKDHGYFWSTESLYNDRKFWPDKSVHDLLEIGSSRADNVECLFEDLNSCVGREYVSRRWRTYKKRDTWLRHCKKKWCIKHSVVIYKF